MKNHQNACIHAQNGGVSGTFGRKGGRKVDWEEGREAGRKGGRKWERAPQAPAGSARRRHLQAPVRVFIFP